MLGLSIEPKILRAAILSDGGDFVCVEYATTPPDSYRECLVAIRDLVAKVATHDAQPIGVAVPGNLRDDVVTSSPMGFLNGKSLLRDLQASLGRKVVIRNSGHCFTAFEANYLVRNTPPDSPPPQSVFGMFIDVNCHGGFYVSGQILNGRNAGVGNWAHMPLPSPVPYELDGQECWCGRTGCLETFLSATGIEDDYYKITETRLTCLEIAAAAANNDIVAESAIQVLEDRIGRATAAIINLVDPDVIVLGGIGGGMERLARNVPRKWPGYVPVKKPLTQLCISAHADLSVVGGACLSSSQH